MTAGEGAAPQLLGAARGGVAAAEVPAACRGREVALEEPVALGGQPGQRRAHRVTMWGVRPGEEDEETRPGHRGPRPGRGASAPGNRPRGAAATAARPKAIPPLSQETLRGAMHASTP